MFRKVIGNWKMGERITIVLLTGCLYQESPGAFMSSPGTSTKNPQLSASISSSVGGVMRVRLFIEGFWPADWEATSVSRDMHAVLEWVLPHPLLRDSVLLALLRDANEEFEVLSCKASDDKLILETPEFDRDDRCMVEVFIIVWWLMILMVSSNIVSDVMLCVLRLTRLSLWRTWN